MAATGGYKCEKLYDDTKLASPYMAQESTDAIDTQCKKSYLFVVT